jgi:hypothetical protein
MVIIIIIIITIIVINCNLPIKPFCERVCKKRGSKFYSKSFHKENMLRREVIIMYKMQKNSLPKLCEVMVGDQNKDL